MNHPHKPAAERSNAWIAAVCLLLLGATFLNYANRFAFTQNVDHIQGPEFNASKEEYGRVAGLFGLGFACGGLLFGILSDLVSVRILFPLVVVVWSLAGLGTGLMETLAGMAACRFVLGFFEAGHWPCALRTTQRVFRPHQRTWGNSVLQSGAALGAVATPQLINALHAWDPSQWRLVFFIVGGLGLPWAVWWLVTMRESDVRRPVLQTDERNPGIGKERELEEIPFFRVFLTRRWWLLLVVVVCINTLWHYIRVWMPDMLMDDHGYSRPFVQNFTSLYYLSTFFGSLASGAATVWLVRRGWNVHRSRLLVFFVFGGFASLSIAAAFLPTGNLLLGVLLLVAFGSLGLFPVYYSLNQEISAKNQGKVGGSLGFVTWVILFFVHPLIGRLVDQQPDIRPYLFAVVGLGPLLAFLVLAFFWGQRATPQAAD